MENELIKNGKTKYLILSLLLFATIVFCICLGSVNIPLADVFNAFVNSLKGLEPKGPYESIIIHVRTPRVLSVALVGMALSLSGAVMQGLLKNPLADGSTLGVSTGASLGAVLAIVLGIRFTALPFAGTMIMAIIFAFLSLIFILSLSYKLDYSLSTNTIILMGIIFSMFVNSLISLLLVFSGDNIKSIIFWSMGSLQGSTYENVVVLLIAVIIFSIIIISKSDELNAFALGEEIASNLGVDTKKIKLILLITSSALIGITVSVGGTIGFVGLVIPHITRLITGPNHMKLLPSSMFIGSSFLMVADLVARTMFKPLELPIGVVTSLIGSVLFVYIFSKNRMVR